MKNSIDRQHLLARVPVRVRVGTADSTGPVHAVPSVAAGVDAATADPVPAAGCEKLAEDAALSLIHI